MKLFTALACASFMLIPTLATSQVTVVGSSTVYPFATVVAETLSKTTTYKTPVIESTGTGGGMKLFCAGIGDSHPDATNASRAIKKSEKETCEKNGVTPIEVKVGYDGIVIANSKEGELLTLSHRDLFLALAKMVPDGSGTLNLIENPFKTWNEINPNLPMTRIEVLGPPPTSGTRDAFLELVMEVGAKSFPELVTIRKSDKKKFKAIAHSIREDGAYIDAGENDNLIVQKLVANSKALGIFGFSFLEENRDKIQGSLVNGVEPTFENIASGSYSVSRPLYFYVKKQHIEYTPGLKEYVELFLSEKMSGSEGQLLDKGLIPMPVEERLKNRDKVLSQF